MHPMDLVSAEAAPAAGTSFARRLAEFFAENTVAAEGVADRQAPNTPSDV